MSYIILDGIGQKQIVYAPFIGASILPAHALVDAFGGFIAVPSNPLAARLYDINGNALGTSSNPIYSAPIGSFGVDYSVNQPTLPLLGNNFANLAPYNNFVLVQTIPASQTRANYRIKNISGLMIVIIRDDGTATTGQSLSNATCYWLASGDLDSDPHFKGRLQILAPSSSSQIAISVE